MITFYDLAGNDNKTWSPNLWKTRYVLNYKGLPYRTIHVELHEIQRTSIEAGIPPSSKGVDGSPKYTVPAIVDDSTGVAVTDSYKIAEYLDKQYPDTPQVIPTGTEALQAAFYQNLLTAIRPFGAFTMLLIPLLLSEKDKEYYYSSREQAYGRPLREMMPKEAELDSLWVKFEELLDQLAGWYSKSPGKFLTGDNPTFGGFTLGGIFTAYRIMAGKESEEWKRVSLMSGGRWVKLLNDLEKYADISK